MQTEKHGLPDARVIVIGGGVGGCSAAYHLATLGMTDVVLLERATLSSGTTWHSTGNLETYRDDPLIFEMVRYAVDSLPRVQQESGQEIGWRNVGRVYYTDREDRLAFFRTLPELGRMRGIEIALLTPEEVGRRLPIIDIGGLNGGIWVPSDGRVNPTDVVMAYARAARARGVRIQENTRVLEVQIRDGVVRGVVTDQGTVGCDTVIIAAGVWSNTVANSCGVQLPLYALEHQYVITRPIPGLDRNMPLFLSYDDQLYGREEVGGLIVGSFDDNARPIATTDLPQNFAFTLLSERWDQFELYMSTAMRRFPVMATVGIKMLLNGPESFTPDGHMLLGPVPGVDGLYVACGFNSNGIAFSPAAGKFIAEWIVEGAPSADIARLDVRRFAALQSSEAYIRERVTEIPGYFCREHTPVDDFATARNIRLSPVHASLAAAGARFGSVSGWERPLWVTSDHGSWEWLAGVAAEVDAAAGHALLVDRSADTKVALLGADVRSWLDARLGSSSTVDSVARTAVFPGRYGEVEAFGRILPWSGGLLLTVDPEQESRLTEWLRRARPPQGVQAVDITAGWALFELMGPNRSQTLSALISAVGTPTVGTAARTCHWAGAVPARVIADPTHDSTLVLVPADGAVHFWTRLLEVGGSCGLCAGGHLAQEALRIARGVPRFGLEATPGTLASEILARPSTSNLDAPTAVPKAAPVGHLSRRLAAFSTTPGLLGFGAHETIVQNGQVVGEMTSRVCLPEWPQTLLLALLRTDLPSAGPLELVAAGQRWPLMPRPTAWPMPSRLAPRAQ
jgi:glycine/D-amino acid oxidase-like deaminating enzyme/glycine cleavage system aminomethyltransferase T